MMVASSDALLFLPLGGAGEIGMNLNLYGLGPPGTETWLMVDLGVTFSDGTVPGVDVIMPDPAFIAERRDRLAGLVLTHAHEDHLGAVPYLWQQLQCPIYATPFTAEVLRRKLQESNFSNAMDIIEVPLGGRFDVGPFNIELITMTHSIPEPNALAIRTALGTVLHTGDWKLDPSPVIGPTSDEDALRKLGDEGVLAAVCDSTNVFVPGTSGSEADLLPSLTDLIAKCHARVAVTCFASNVARLQTIVAAAHANDRDVVLVGRSLHRFEAVARATGYLADVPAFIDETDAGYLPKDKTLIICTGSQGEPRAALARIAAGNHPNITLSDGDTLIFSSRVIPGNETAIDRMQDVLVARGIEIITWKTHFVHVSGHPARDELTRMYQYLRPKIAIPVHGETRHLVAHASLARECQVNEALVAPNGTMVRLAPGNADAIDHVSVGRLYLDGNRLVASNGEVIRSRNRALLNGVATISVVLDDDGWLVGEPQLSVVGLMEEPDEHIEKTIRDVMIDGIKKLSAEERFDDVVVHETVRLAVRRTFRDVLGKKPITHVHLIRMKNGRMQNGRIQNGKN